MHGRRIQNESGQFANVYHSMIVLRSDLTCLETELSMYFKMAAFLIDNCCAKVQPPKKNVASELTRSVAVSPCGSSKVDRARHLKKLLPI